MIQKDGITAGFTGDTLMCSNVKEIVRKSKIVFVDMSFKTNSKAHMGVNNIVELKEQYAPKHLIVPTHMSDDVIVAYNQLYDDAPNDDTSYNI
ncbi:MAG: hypothetical protein NC489_30455 [Ruminococcus flavefaciens]|nr:hypothetical protein [Ruminococcus flavefaciens]